MNDRYTSDYLERDTAFLLCLSLPFQRDERIEKDLSLSISFWPEKISRKRGRGGGGERERVIHIFFESKVGGPVAILRFSQDLCPPTPFNHVSYTVIIAPLLLHAFSPPLPESYHTHPITCVSAHLLYENSSATFHDVPPSFLLAESTFSTRPISPYFLALKHATDIKNRTC